MNPGKQFETDWKNSIPNDVWYYRFRDGTASFGGQSDNVRFQQTNICDCEIYRKPYLWLLELKSHKNKSIPFKCIVDESKKSQVEKVNQLMKATAKGVWAFYIFNFRDLNKTYAIPVIKAANYMMESKTKSFAIAWAEDNGILIPQKQLKVNWRYDVNSLLECGLSA